MSEHEEKGEYKVDKTGWGEGPWHSEPDKVLWKAEGLDCMVIRGPVGGLCGYVGVTEKHPHFGKPYQEVEADCHGGLTYSDYCQGHICHPSPERTYWFGFDCNHWGDVVPGMQQYRLSEGHGHYRDLAYVKAEVEKLAKQLAAVA